MSVAYNPIKVDVQFNHHDEFDGRIEYSHPKYKSLILPVALAVPAGGGAAGGGAARLAVEEAAAPLAAPLGLLAALGGGDNSRTPAPPVSAAAVAAAAAAAAAAAVAASAPALAPPTTEAAPAARTAAAEEAARIAARTAAAEEAARTAAAEEAARIAAAVRLAAARAAEEAAAVRLAAAEEAREAAARTAAAEEAARTAAAREAAAVRLAAEEAARLAAEEAEEEARKAARTAAAEQAEAVAAEEAEEAAARTAAVAAAAIAVAKEAEQAEQAASALRTNPAAPPAPAPPTTASTAAAAPAASTASAAAPAASTVSAAPAASGAATAASTEILTPLYYKTVSGDGDCFYHSLYKALVERPALFDRVKSLFGLIPPFDDKEFNNQVRAFTTTHPLYINKLYGFYDFITDLINTSIDTPAHIIETLQSGTTRVQRAALGLSIDNNTNGSYSLKDKSDNIIYTYSINSRNDVENISSGPGIIGNIQNRDNFVIEYQSKFLEKKDGAGAYATADEATFIKEMLSTININVTYIINNQNPIPQLLNENGNDNIFLFNDGVNHYNYFSIRSSDAASGGAAGSAPSSSSSTASTASTASRAGGAGGKAAATGGAGGAAATGGAGGKAPPAKISTFLPSPSQLNPSKLDVEQSFTQKIVSNLATSQQQSEANDILRSIPSKNLDPVHTFLDVTKIIKVPFFSKYDTYSNYAINAGLIRAFKLNDTNLYVIHQSVSDSKNLFRPHAFYMGSNLDEEYYFFGHLYIYNYNTYDLINIPLINVHYHDRAFSPNSPEIDLNLQDGINTYYVKFIPITTTITDVKITYPIDKSPPSPFEGIFFIEKNNLAVGVIENKSMYIPQVPSGSNSNNNNNGILVHERRRTRSKQKNQRKRTLKR